MNKTFSIGGVHPSDNKLSANAPIEIFQLPDRAIISMSQHLGTPSTPIVAVGDRVKSGQLIAKAAGFISANIHSPVSGTVVSLGTERDIFGNPAMSVVVNREGDDWDESIDRSPDLDRDIRLSGREIIARIAECGIVGLGGAAFPTHIKLSPPPGKQSEFLIINGSECEPYLTSDYRLMMEKSEHILVGISAMMRALNVNTCYIGIEVNKPDAISLLLDICLSRYPEIKIVPLKTRYPQGGEKQLIDAIIGRRVPSMGLPIDVGAVVQNIGTAYSVYEAVQKNKPLIENIISVTGGVLGDAQRNLLVRMGTPICNILDFVGGISDRVSKIVSGGPMMGKAISNIDAATVKTTSSLLLLTDRETVRGKESNCIRCAKCVSVCPMGLEPYLLNRLSRAGKMEELEDNLVYDCIECGSCLYTCPANIPLLDTIRYSKAQILKIMRGRKTK